MKNTLVVILKYFCADLTVQQIFKGKMDTEITLKLCTAIFVNFLLVYAYKVILYDGKDVCNKYDFVMNYICLFLAIFATHIIFLDDFMVSVKHSFNFTNELVLEKLIYYVLQNEYKTNKKVNKIISLLTTKIIFNIYNKKDLLKNVPNKIIEYIIIELL